MTSLLLVYVKNTAGGFKAEGLVGSPHLTAHLVGFRVNHPDGFWLAGADAAQSLTQPLSGDLRGHQI